MFKRVLVFGSSGYIGSEFVKQLGAQTKVVAAPPHNTLKGYGAIRDVIKSLRPDLVINAAGYTGKPNVDACEADKGRCIHGNITFPLWIAQACDAAGVMFGHVSSGCIYNGYDKQYTEDDAPDFAFDHNNCSFYSGTKAQSEQLLKDYENIYIWRLRIPFNHENNPRNYLTKMLNYPTILDLPNSVSHREEFVSSCVKLASMEADPGIYNVTNPGSITASRLFELFIENRPETAYTIGSKVYFSDMQEFMSQVKAARSNCVLDVSKMQAAGVLMRPVEEAIVDSIKKYQL
jgi:dTDP-4-dehydrorhamnose reductase